MFYKAIELSPKNPSVSYKETKDFIWHFLFTLECNGQILKNYKVIQNKNILLYVTTPKSDSLSEQYDSVYVKGDKERICEYYNVKVKECGIDLESHEYCTCEKRGALEMQTFRFDIDSVFTCCGCGKPVALYELPHPAKRDDYNDIQLWQENYAAMDMLWMNCLCDRYTGNQRVKHDSALNKQGIQIARSLSKQLGVPVYYHLECDYGKSIKAEKVGDQQIHVCPECKTRMKRTRFSEDYEIDVCEACLLSYTAH